MGTRKSTEELSLKELRRLVVEKKRKLRMAHLDRFRKTGRVVPVDSEVEGEPLEQLHSSVRLEDPAYHKLLGRQKIKRVFDRLLFIVEVLAVLGLVAIVYTGVKILRDLNTEFAQSRLSATRTPTPLIVPVILPSGHTPPDSTGGSQPNVAEIPVQLRPLYQSMANQPIPTSGPEQATQIQIPAIEVDAPIVQGDGWEQLKEGVAQHIGSVNPGQVGNIVLSAHNDVYGEIFRDLDHLVQGDKIIIFTARHTYTYIVTDIQIVEPTDVEVMGSTSDPTVTLISCYPYWVDSQRIIVQGSLQTGSN